ncbi:MAG TPA: hypothetical protein VFQ85_13010 [Mycobacteriales bacterium]|nr:hypothetical protein [Mycobacteriales bacterium]
MPTTSLRDQDSLVYRFDVGHDGALWLARQLCEQWLRDRHVRSDAVCDLVLAVAEVCAGAALWPTAHVVVRGHIDGTDVEVTVETSGATPPVEDDTVRPAGGDLRLAAALVDELVLRVQPERSVVSLRRHGVILPG